MGIEYRIDDAHRMVIAKAQGVVTHQDVLAYQREVWSRADVAGYDELFDMTSAEGLVPPSKESVRETSTLAASMDCAGIASKFAIVAPTDLAFGIGRMYQSYRECDGRSTKKVAVFRSLESALQWLGSDPISLKQADT
jgi:hypothetical protein